MNKETLEVLSSRFSELLSSYKKIVVAYSGGLDSHVLLHLLVNSCGKKEKSKLIVLHINHNISPHSKKWANHCQRVCDRLKVKYIDKDVNAKVKLDKGSLEEKLRKKRYEIFADVLPKESCLLTAHHADDQAETLLLQLFRGSGPKGLASMPVRTKFAKGWLVRPLLDCLRLDLFKYAKKHKLKWIEDESNFDTKFDRNFVRHQLIPKIQKKWPGVVAALNRTARNCAETDELLEVLAKKDLLVMLSPSAPRTSSQNAPRMSSQNATRMSSQNATRTSSPNALIGDPGTINIKPLKKLSYARQKNVIRFWLNKLNLTLPSEVKLNEIMRTVINSRYDRVPMVTWQGGEVRRFRNDLYAMLPLSKHDNKEVFKFSGKSLKLPGDLGVLKIRSVSSTATSSPQKWGSSRSGFDLKKLKVTFRQGGEKIKLPGRKGTRDLKKLMQEWNIPPWQRDRVPLVYYNEKLIAVVGYYNDDWINFQ